MMYMVVHVPRQTPEKLERPHVSYYAREQGDLFEGQMLYKTSFTIIDDANSKIIRFTVLLS